MLSETERGRLFRLKIERNKAARAESTESVAQVPHCGLWIGRIGGAVRGRMITGSTRRDVVDQVDRHYNRTLYEYVKELNRR